MLNPDGVALGNYRCSLMGFDLNRHWRDTNPWAQPGLHAVKTYLVQLEKDEEVDFCFDIHAHSMATGESCKHDPLNVKFRSVHVRKRI